MEFTFDSTLARRILHGTIWAHAAPLFCRWKSQGSILIINPYPSNTFSAMASYLLCTTGVVFYSLLLLGVQVQSYPSIRWVRRLKGCGSISDASPRRGNGVVSAPNGQTVWITDDEGALHILDADNYTKDEIYFRPPLVANRWTESRSSVSLHVDPNGIAYKYAVYAVIDVANDPNATSSRIISVHGDGELIGTLFWQLPLEGIVVQTPQIGTDGHRIYAVHNDANGRGHFSIIDAEGNRIRSQSSPKPFGPITILSDDGNDEIYWGESDRRGYSDSGRIYHHDSGLEVTDVGYEIFTSTVVPPVLWREKKRRRMWLGGRTSTVYGWVDGESLANAPSWTKSVSPSRRNESYPIASPIASSPDGLRLYVASASTLFYCLNGKNGNIIWKAESYDSVFLNGAVLSPDYSSIYSIQHRDGTVEKRSAATGDLMWSFNCTSIPGRHRTCQDSVEAQFSLSNIGNTLYYVDIWGNVVSLLVDDFPTSPPSFLPTPQPSGIPSISMYPSLSSEPSAASEGPSSAPTLSSEPSAEPSLNISATPSSSPSSLQEPSAKPSTPQTPTNAPFSHISTAPSISSSQTDVPSEGTTGSNAPSHVTSPYQSALNSPQTIDHSSPWLTSGANSVSETKGPTDASLSPSPFEAKSDEVDSRAPPRISATNGTQGYLSGRTESSKVASNAAVLRSLTLPKQVCLSVVKIMWLIIA